MIDRPLYYLADRFDPVKGYKEQPSQASTVGILPCSNREGTYTNESHKEFDGDISKLMGALA